ncbi:MAG: cation diffusion facilitator family transporter, partial [Mailhella sp.]
LWSALLTIIKLAAGISTNSLGLLSEALHSLLDFAAAGITCLAVRISAQPADENHPYGHGKAESLAALAETVLLLVTCVWIVMEAGERLFFAAGPVEPSWWAFAVVMVSLAVDISRSAMLRRVAKEHKSQALEADAMHFTTDIWSSAVVLAGLACVSLAAFTSQGSPLHRILTNADAVAALGVACIVLKVSYDMARNAVLTLMDGGMDEQTRQVRAALAANAPAYAVRSVRVRESGARHFVELVVSAPSDLRVDMAHEISTMLEGIVRSVLPDAETTVHMEPEEENRRDCYATSYRLASLHGLPIHNLRLVTQGEGMYVEVHIELPDDMPLSEAHEKVTAYEQDLCRRVGAMYVVSHMEPKSGRGRSSASSVNPGDAEKAVQRALEHSELCEAHHIHVNTGEDGSTLSFHCRSYASTVGEGHALASRLEEDIRKILPAVGQIVIHVEPKSR